ncbi:MAG: NAD(P)/FAD-dependent oxidoreductase [Actinomycetota bacterium]
MLDALVVGAGFSGLYQLHRLRQEGFAVRLVEAGSGLGGVWQQNRYPGARVDSHVINYEYSLPEIWRDWVWAERFPGRDELVAYFEHVDSVLDLSRDIDLDTRVKRATWRPDAGQWEIEATNDRAYAARHLIMCTGFGSKPYLPDFDGLDSFTGEAHHTARWPAHGVDLAGKRVGVIGVGASGVQVVQEAAPVAEHLVVFQRTPVTALPMQQRALSADEQALAKVDYAEVFARRNAPPGTFHDLNRLEVSALSVTPERRAEVYDEALAQGGFHFWGGTFVDILFDEEANRTAYEHWRDRTRIRIDDPVTAELLAPTDPPYPFGTKRPSLEQGYYECFNQPNVELVDVRAHPIETITAAGVQTTDRHHDLDVLVLATGFDANTGGLTAIDIRGDDGRTLADQWRAGVDTHLGLAIPGFTNLLMLYGPQSPTAFCNGPVCAEVQGEWVVSLLDHMRRNDLTRLTTSTADAEAWSAHLADLADSTLFGRTDSWYMAANIPGKRRQLLNYPSTDAYFTRLEQCEADGYDGFELS